MSADCIRLDAVWALNACSLPNELESHTWTAPSAAIAHINLGVARRPFYRTSTAGVDGVASVIERLAMGSSNSATKPVGLRAGGVTCRCWLAGVAPPRITRQRSNASRSLADHLVFTTLGAEVGLASIVMIRRAGMSAA